MARMLTIRQASDGNVAQINEELLIWIEDDTLGSEVTYLKEVEGNRYRLISSDTRTQIQAMSTEIIPVATNGKTVGMNYNRMNLMQYDGSGSTFLYDVSGQVPRPVDSTDSVGTLQTRIYTKQGLVSGTDLFTFDAVNATNNTISLASSFGNETTAFANPVTFQVYGSGDTDLDGMYTVSSSQFSGGKTVITVIENIPAGVATTGYILLGS